MTNKPLADGGELGQHQCLPVGTGLLGRGICVNCGASIGWPPDEGTPGFCQPQQEREPDISGFDDVVRKTIEITQAAIRDARADERKKVIEEAIILTGKIDQWGLGGSGHRLISEQQMANALRRLANKEKL